MKIKLLDIWLAVPVFNQLSKAIPGKIAYKLARIKSILDERYKEIEKQRNELITKYGEMNENNIPQIKPKTDGLNNFIKEFKELLEQDCEITFDHLITQTDLESIECTINMLQKLQFCIEE